MYSSNMAEVLDQIMKRLDQIQSQQYKLDQVIERLDNFSIASSQVIEKLQTICGLSGQWKLTDDTAPTYLERFSQLESRRSGENKVDLLTQVASSETIRADNFRKVKMDLEQVKTSITSLAENFDKVEKEMATVVMRIDKVETSFNVGQKAVIEELAALKQLEAHVTTTCEQSTSDVKNYIYRCKREIFAVTEKEAQIVRERIKGPLPSHGNYTFDFYVENFKQLVMSEKEVDSLPWHINELKSAVKGYVAFNKNGLMEVCLLCARHPREVGLEPRSGITLKVKAKVCDIYKKMLPDISVGEKTWVVKENCVPRNTGYGVKLGRIACDQLLIKGYGDIEGYWFGSILVRFEVTTV